MEKRAIQFPSTSLEEVIRSFFSFNIIESSRTPPSPQLKEIIKSSPSPPPLDIEEVIKSFSSLNIDEQTTTPKVEKVTRMRMSPKTTELVKLSPSQEVDIEATETSLPVAVHIASQNIGDMQKFQFRADNAVPPNKKIEEQIMVTNDKQIELQLLLLELLRLILLPPGAIEIDTTTPGAIQIDTNLSRALKIDTTTPRAIEIDTNTPRAIEIDTTTPRAIEIDTTTRAIEIDTTTPGAIEIDNNTPGAIQIDTTTPGAIDIDTTTPRAIEIDTTTPELSRLILLLSY
ncbi:unnamed protein product [Mytilus edulis]|uniref:Uncharacterized protein n=1 Tax=Mytilus edulis TaxID=6550 RepID=A0A8S3RDY2_MYTED|nr:unnamed protein product [Mytilus edulis]